MTSAEIERVFAISQDLKAKLQQGLREPLLAGRVAALLFEKPSLRTRVSFETGMAQLGGSSLFLGAEVGWGQRESIADLRRCSASTSTSSCAEPRCIARWKQRPSTRAAP